MLAGPAGYGYNYPVRRVFSLACVYEFVRVACSREKPRRRETSTHRLIRLVTKCAMFSFLEKNTWLWAPENYFTFL